MLQASPSDGDALCMRGASSNRAEQLHAALGDLSRTMTEVLPSGPKTRGKALRHRVEVLLKLGRYDAAVSDVDACLATDPLNPVVQSLRGRTVASLSAVPTLNIGVLFQQSVGGTGTGTGSAGTANSGIRSHDVDVALAHALRGYGACNVVGLPPAAQLHAAS